VPSLNEECALMHPLQGASFLSTPLQGGILKPPALRVVGDLAVHVGSRLYTDSASSYRAVTGYVHEFVNHTLTMSH